jgi:hypothetical protein
VQGQYAVNGRQARGVGAAAYSGTHSFTSVAIWTEADRKVTGSHVADFSPASHHVVVSNVPVRYLPWVTRQTKHSYKIMVTAFVGDTVACIGEWPMS